MKFLIASLSTLLVITGLYAFQRPFREYPGREYENFPLPEDWQEKTEWAFARLMYPATNRARGLLYVDRVTKKSHELTARAVVLCAQSQESTRILLNSGTREHPNGLANSSGALGHYLTAHVRSGGGKGEFPEFSHKKTYAGPN